MTVSGDQAREVAERRGNAVHVPAAFDDGFAGVERFERRQVLGVGVDGVGNPVEQACTLARAGLAPRAFVECATGGGDGALRIGHGGVGRLRQDVFVGGIDDVAVHAAFGLHPLAVDIEIKTGSQCGGTEIGGKGSLRHIQYPGG